MAAPRSIHPLRRAGATRADRAARADRAGTARAPISGPRATAAHPREAARPRRHLPAGRSAAGSAASSARSDRASPADPMRRIVCEERTDWRATAERVGFLFHTIDGEPYWDESAYYGFTLQQIERDIEAPTAELEAMCRELVARAVKDERILRALQIPERFWTFIAASMRRNEASLYGRFDLSYDANGPAKLLEYNADTPTSVFETAVFQWTWLEEAIARQIIPRNADQYNSLHERLVAAWKPIGQGRHVHFAGVTDSAEDLGTLAYLEDTARQAGLATTILAIGDIGRTPRGQFVDRDERPIEIAFKLYPWEWMFREE